MCNENTPTGHLIEHSNLDAWAHEMHTHTRTHTDITHKHTYSHIHTHTHTLRFTHNQNTQSEMHTHTHQNALTERTHTHRAYRKRFSLILWSTDAWSPHESIKSPTGAPHRNCVFLFADRSFSVCRLIISCLPVDR